MKIVDDYLKSQILPVPKRAKHMGMGSDLYLKHCIKCDMVWEKTSRTGGNQNKSRIIHYKDFPKYGKTKKLCWKCR